MRFSGVNLLSLLLLISLVVLSFGNAQRPLDRIQESRVAETAREMVLDQQWLLPHFNGDLRLQKPPLSYWVTALSFQSFGINEFSLRLPSLLFGLASVGMIFIWLARRLDHTTGFVAALMLLTSLIGMRYFRSAEADAMLIFFITLSLMAFDFMLLATQQQQVKLWRRVVMLSMGLAFLSKGPAGLAIPLFTLLLYAWQTQRSRLRILFQDGVAWSLFIVSACGWYAWIWGNMPEIASQFFTQQLDETFVSGTHIQPWYWYLAHAFEFFSPWGVLLVPALWFFWHQRPYHALIKLASTWLVVVLVLLTLTVNKQTQYALLLLPPVAILLAYYYVHAGTLWQTLHASIAGLLLISVSILLALVIWQAGLTLPLLGLCCFCLFPVLILKAWRAPRDVLVSAMIWALSASTIYLLVEQYLRKSDDKQDIKQLALQSQHLRPMVQFKPGNGAISFYAGDIVHEISAIQLPTIVQQGAPVWVMAKKSTQFPNMQAFIVLQSGSWAVWQVSK